jgi:hypothetical protein
MNEEELEELQERVKLMRNSLLFEEPCPLFEPFEEEEVHG